MPVVWTGTKPVFGVSLLCFLQFALVAVSLLYGWSSYLALLYGVISTALLYTAYALAVSVEKK